MPLLAIRSLKSDLTDNQDIVNLDTYDFNDATYEISDVVPNDVFPPFCDWNRDDIQTNDASQQNDTINGSIIVSPFASSKNHWKNIEDV